MNRVKPTFAAPAAGTLLLVAIAISGGCGGSSGSSGSSGDGGRWTLVGWNTLGRHWMDSDYSVFSFQPPLNVVHAQLIDPSGRLVTGAGGPAVTYRAVADATGSINSWSAGKTDWWLYAALLHPGTAPTPDVGLRGAAMPGLGNAAQPMTFLPGAALYEADGIPITPIDDAGRERHHPLLRLEARSGDGALLADTVVDLPVFDRPGCATCHASIGGLGIMPSVGFAYDPDADRDFRLNILGLHDDFQLAEPVFQAALQTLGYDERGLRKTVTSGGIPVRCSACHASNALPGSGLPGIHPLTVSVHGLHAFAWDPVFQTPLEFVPGRGACHRCHPGGESDLLRGPMGTAVAADGLPAISCRDCHGPMTAVADPAREGWLDQPACQNCHTGTAVANRGQIRFTNAFDPPGQLRDPADPVFATITSPGGGPVLYRESTGHGGLRCAACHGPPHAESPSAAAHDNLQAVALQGHAGKLAECSACHPLVPETVDGGPHGLHPVGQAWVGRHGQVVRDGGSISCRNCHGADDLGTELSRAQADRELVTPWGPRSFWRGQRISCFACHDGPAGQNATQNAPPWVEDAAAATATATDPVTIPLAAGDPNGDPVTLRVVAQPAHGRVALSGTQATYHPVPGFAGVDVFTVAAWDGRAESPLATVSVRRGAEWASYGVGYPGLFVAIPVLEPDAPPVLGTTIRITVGNVSGAPAPALLVVGREPASLPTPHGSFLLAFPDSVTSLSLPPEGLVIDWTLPAAPSLTGLSFFAQCLHSDPAAVLGVAFSRGLRLTLGP